MFTPPEKGSEEDTVNITICMSVNEAGQCLQSEDGEKLPQPQSTMPEC